jgi:hypothetical protein
MADISVSLNILTDSGLVIEVSDATPLKELVPQILAHLNDATQLSPVTAEQSMVFIARPITDPRRTLAQLGVRTGDTIHIVRLSTYDSQIGLELCSAPNAPSTFSIRVSHSPVVLGVLREGSQTTGPVDIDLAPYLPADKQLALSRRQAELVEEDGVWSVRLVEGAQAPLFCDGQRVTATRLTRLADRSVLAFGPSPNRPDFAIIVRLVSK